MARFSRNSPHQDLGDGHEYGGEGGGPNAPDDDQDPLNSDQEQGVIPLNHFYGFPSPHPQPMEDDDGGIPMPGPSSAGSTAAQGGAANQSTPGPSGRPPTRNQVWRDRIEVVIKGVLVDNGIVDILLMVDEVTAALGQETTDGLARHLRDSGSSMTVDTYIQKVLWDGYDRGLWDRGEEEWRVKRHGPARGLWD